MSESPVEKIFEVLNESSQILQHSLSCTYLEALAETGENLFEGKILQEGLKDNTIKKLEDLYHHFNIGEFSKEQVRKAYQLAMLKGMKDYVQANHQMTPDTIGLFMSYLISKFMDRVQAYSMLDPAVGTGNLLTTILNQQENKNITAYGVEIDEILIKLAYVGANLQQQQIEFFNQDSLAHLFIDPVDVVVCDLPVGYYPNDIGANEYILKADQGHSYAHHLFIEQSLKHTKPGGYLFFLIPNQLFESKEAPKLHQFLKEHAYIQAILQLPLSIFKNEQSAKSIFVLQKTAENISAPNQVLLANLPSLSNQQAVQDMIKKIDAWCAENIPTNS
ncbi:class I SAM-dependent methyltransferase [Heyndrickxia ginsengihumi]|uniref:class I SAM-dependent methyltransferase n=1 Tax=Heyndrickxia ginsengihumi TaxID=363870 RepID=UPI003D1E19F2